VHATFEPANALNKLNVDIFAMVRTEYRSNRILHRLFLNSAKSVTYFKISLTA